MLAFNPVIDDSVGWPCLRFHNAKMAAEQLVPLSARAAEAIGAQQDYQAASVSRAWLYRVPELRAEIERLRTGQRRRATRLPSGQRASADSLRRRIESLIDANRLLREENRRLNDRLASVLGEARSPSRS